MSRVAAADESENLAPKAKVWASSHRGEEWAAQYAVDGKIPMDRSEGDRWQAWACNSEQSGDQAEFTLEWPYPIEAAEIVYWGRTASLGCDCWKDYEIYLDNAPKPAIRGTLKMVSQPQRIDLPLR